MQTSFTSSSAGLYLYNPRPARRLPINNNPDLDIDLPKQTPSSQFAQAKQTSQKMAHVQEQHWQPQGRDTRNGPQEYIYIPRSDGRLGGHPLVPQAGGIPIPVTTYLGPNAFPPTVPVEIKPGGEVNALVPPGQYPYPLPGGYPMPGGYGYPIPGTYPIPGAYPPPGPGPAPGPAPQPVQTSLLLLALLSCIVSICISLVVKNLPNSLSIIYYLFDETTTNNTFFLQVIPVQQPQPVCYPPGGGYPGAPAPVPGPGPGKNYPYIHYQNVPGINNYPPNAYILPGTYDNGSHYTNHIQQPAIGQWGLTGAEVTQRQLATAHGLDMNNAQEMKPSDDDPLRMYWVRDLDNTYVQHNRLTIDSGDIGPVRWYVVDGGTFYAVKLPAN